MRVLNIHERELTGQPSDVGILLDSLASQNDRLWPRHSWPPMRFDRPLGAGAAGGHGPVRYTVEEYIPGRKLKFRFTGPRGFVGHHWFEVLHADAGRALLRHTIQMDARGPAVLSWPLVFRPLHDALLEDLLALAQANLGVAPEIRPWSAWVKLLRWVISGGRSLPQQKPGIAAKQDASHVTRHQ